MRRLKNMIFVLVVFSVILSGCASTEIEGVSKPGVDLTKVDDILVFANFNNLKSRKYLETEICKRFISKGKKAYKSVALMPPLKDYSSDECNEIIETYQIKYLLEIKIITSSSDIENGGSVFFPVGGMYFGGSSSETILNVDYDISLYDIQSQELVLKAVASNKSEEDDFAECVEESLDSLARDLISKYFVVKE